MVAITGKHWREVYGRIWSETLDEIRWDRLSRILRDVLVAVIAVWLAWQSTHRLVLTGSITVAVIVFLGVGVFLWKIVTVPPRMAAEHEAEVTRLTTLLETSRPRRDKTISEALCYVQFGVWGRVVNDEGGGIRDDLWDNLDLIEEAADEGAIQFWGKAAPHLNHQKIKKDFWTGGKKIDLTTFLFRDEGVATKHHPIQHSS